MKFTEEMINEDEKRWHARDIVTELGYCGNYMRDSKNMTNLDIRFYAYIMRKAHDMLKDQEPVEPEHNLSSLTDWFCGKCGRSISRFEDYCSSCGQAVKWE